MENCMQSLLRDFYSTVNRAHSQKQQRIDLLDRFLQKLKTGPGCPSENDKQKIGIQYQTQTSFGDLEAAASNTKPLNAQASGMLYTFLLPSPENQKESRYKVTSQKAFKHSSIFKTIAYALFINFLHINKQAGHTDCQQNLGQTLSCAARSVRRIKTAMVAAAQCFKSKDRKRYAKIRYLYDQLLKYTDAASAFKEEYIRVIIDEFDEEFMLRTFECLRKKGSQLNASQSLSNIQLGDSILKDSIDLSEMDRALEYLQVKLIVRDGSTCIQQQLYDGLLNVVVEQSERQGFVLREVITMRSSQE